MIKTHLIKPLLFATEKVFEQIMVVPNTSVQRPREDITMIEEANEDNEPDDKKSSKSDLSNVKAQLVQLSLETGQLLSGQEQTKNTTNLKRRRFRELESCWEIHENSKNKSLIAISEETRSVRSDNAFKFDENMSSGFKNRRAIKLEKKLISRAALETELIRCGRKTPVQGFKEKQTFTSVFSTLIYDLQADCIDNLKETDQQAIRDQIKSQPKEGSYEQVDTIRFIKTNKLYYNRIILLFLKYFTVNRVRMQQAFTQKTELEKILSELQQYLQEGKTSSSHSSSTLAESS